MSAEIPQPFICLSCGGPIASSLANAGSPRYHDCREAHAPLRIDLFTRKQLMADHKWLAEAA